MFDFLIGLHMRLRMHVHILHVYSIYSLLYILLLLPLSIFALPQGSKIIHGCIAIEQSANQMLITQKCEKALIDWKDFSLNEKENLKFIQKDNFSVLNRVITDKISQIYGSIEASGKFYLINQNGILIGPRGTISARKILLSTLEMSKEDYLKDKDLKFLSLKNGKVKNFGSIKATSGDVFILSKTIKNKGEISAKYGEANLFAESEILILDEKHDIIIKPEIDGSITNEGTIKAIEVKLISSNNNLDSFAINQKGLIEANGFEKKDGRVILKAETGICQNEGKIIAKNSNNTSGIVHLLADHIGLINAAVIDISSPIGGGLVLLGGDFQGKNPNIKNAKTIFISKEANILADAKENGNGGKVILWADERNHFYGNISAKGGSIKGDGGFVEVSGNYFLDFKGKVDCSATNGENGTLLLDPSNIEITATSPSNPLFVPPTYNPGPGEPNPSNLYVTDLTNALNAGTNVSILTSNGNHPAGKGDIEIKTNVSWTGTGTLTMMTVGKIKITGSTISWTGGSGGTTMLSLTSTNDKVDIKAGSSITFSSDTKVLIDATKDVSIKGNISSTYNTPTANIAIEIIGNGSSLPGFKDGIKIDGGSISSIYGNIKLNGIGSDSGGDVGILLKGGSSITSTGTGANAATVTLTGTGGTVGDNNYGIVLETSTDSINSVDGDITLTGTSLGPNLDNQGIKIFGTVSTSGTSNITLNGTGGTGTTDNNNGIYISGSLGAGSISTNVGSGNITMTGLTQATGSYNRGVYILSGGSVTSSSGNILVQNTKGGGVGSTSFNIGAEITDANSKIETTGTGGITFDNIRSNGTVNDNHAVLVNLGGAIKCSGTGNIDMTNSIIAGQSAVGIDNEGVLVKGTGSVISTTTGSLSITGESDASATGVSASNCGIELENSGVISSLGGTMTLIGIGGFGASYENHGIEVNASSISNTSTGTITLQGTNNATGDDGISLGNPGISVLNAGSITAVDGLIKVQNTTGGGVGSGNYNYGVEVTGNSKIETTGLGGITFTTIGSNGTGDNNFAVFVSAGSAIKCTSSGDIEMISSIIGGAPTSVNLNSGVVITGTSSVLSTSSGDINIIASSQGTGNLNMGVIVDDAAQITSTTGQITIKGTGGGTLGGNFNMGIHVKKNSATISSGKTSGTAISLTGFTTGTGSDNMGIMIGEQSPGTGIGIVQVTGGGDLTIAGTGGATGAVNRNYGVHVKNSGSLIKTTSTSNISITGSTQGTGTDNIGIFLEKSSITSPSTGTIIFTGMGLSVSQPGFFMDNAILSAGSGNITINTDEITLQNASSISGSGELRIVPISATQPINLLNSTDLGLALSETEFGFIQNGFSNVKIGIPTIGQHVVQIGSGVELNFTFNDPITIYSKDITVDRALTSSSAGADTIDFLIGQVLTGTLDLNYPVAVNTKALFTVLGGANDDNFNVTTTSATQKGTFDGGGGTANTLTGSNKANFWNVSATDSGTLGIAPNEIDYSNMQKLIGNNSTDSFTFGASGLLTGASPAIDGITTNPAIQNTVVGPDSGSITWHITADDRGTITTTAGTTSFIKIENFQGGSTTNSFIFDGDFELTGSSGIAGNALGTNTITGPPAATTWSINSTNGGTLATATPKTTIFTNIQNLTGNIFTDLFAIGALGSLTGAINGGAGGSNTVSTAAALVNCTLSLDPFAASIVQGGLTQIETIQGNCMNDTLIGRNNGNNAWTIQNNDNEGIVVNTGGGGDTVTFFNVENIQGGSASDDTFTIVGDINISGTNGISGGGGTNNTLIAPNLNNTFSITDNDVGALKRTLGITTTSFSNIQNLTGGTGNDTFVLSDQKGISGLIVGGTSCAEINTLDYTAYTVNASSSMPPCSAVTGTATNIGGIKYINVFVPPGGFPPTPPPSVGPSRRNNALEKAYIGSSLYLKCFFSR